MSTTPKPPVIEPAHVPAAQVPVPAVPVLLDPVVTCKVLQELVDELNTVLHNTVSGMKLPRTQAVLDKLTGKKK